MTPASSAGARPLARWVSILAHPFVMIALMVGALTARAGTTRDVARNVGLVGAFTIVPVALLIIYKRRQRAWSTVDASHPRERPVLYVVGVASVLALLGYLMVSGRHPGLARGTAVALAMLLVSAQATRWTKVSLHMAAATLTATALTLDRSPIGWMVAAVLPLLAWSRLALGRHKPVEVGFGFAFGLVAGVVMKFP